MGAVEASGLGALAARVLVVQFVIRDSNLGTAIQYLWGI
jgi:hypothetical protein